VARAPAWATRLIGDRRGYPTADAVGIYPADEPAAVSKSLISGTVYGDANNDGRPQPDERGVLGVTVTLTGTDPFGGNITLQASTDADGNWSFAGLPPGT
jgi:SdrD B-like domain